jgi:hypothetical protein
MRASTSTATNGPAPPPASFDFDANSLRIDELKQRRDASSIDIKLVQKKEGVNIHGYKRGPAPPPASFGFDAISLRIDELKQRRDAAASTSRSCRRRASTSTATKGGRRRLQ